MHKGVEIEQLLVTKCSIAICILRMTRSVPSPDLTVYKFAVRGWMTLHHAHIQTEGMVRTMHDKPGSVFRVNRGQQEAGLNPC